MIKTIKVIDLLNKIANGEDTPEEIKYSGKKWRLGINGNKDTDYINNKNIGLFYEYLDSILIECLNDTVEIIEEQQDIDYWEEIHNAFREYSDKLIERFDEISKLLKNKGETNENTKSNKQERP